MLVVLLSRKPEAQPECQSEVIMARIGVRLIAMKIQTFRGGGVGSSGE
jgi:hypothetical protein